MSDSKDLALDLRSKLPRYDIRLGSAAGYAYVHDPRHIAFMASRYKFVSKMLAGLDRVVEMGCGDGFGAPLVAQAVKELICTDIDEGTLQDAAARLSVVKNIKFEYFDFRAGPYSSLVDGLFSVDVIEHIFPAEEETVLTNMARSLKRNGVAMVGTPNKTSDQYASEWSRYGHVNLKDHKTLRSSLEPHFHNVFLFSMNDEVLHTGFYPMAHYLLAVCAHLKDVNTAP